MLLEFSYLAYSAQITELELDELDDTFLEMQSLKEVLVRKEIYEHVNRLDDIPKWHMVAHYAESICELGTPDRYNTEAPEYLHIV
jgi:lysozyme family protein